MNLYVNRYYVPGATGREVVIFDLHANTSTLPSIVCTEDKSVIVVVTASNIVVKDISAVNEDSAPVAVMCDLTTVNLYLRPPTIRWTDLILLDFERCWIQVSGWGVHPYEGRDVIVKLGRSHMSYYNMFLNITLHIL